MNLVADNLWAVVTEATPDELRWLDAYLTVSVKNAEHSEAYQNGVWDGTVRLYDKKKSRLASGLLRLVGGRAREQSIAFIVQDARVKPPVAVDPAAGSWLRPYQREVLNAMLARGRGIVSVPTGGGKCLGEGTLVLMYDGTLRAVEKIRVGDALMGPDSEPRLVMSTNTGRGELRLIEPLKGNPWVCNDVHVMTLVHTETGQTVDVPLNEYEGWSKNQKHLHKLFRVGVDFVPVDAPPPVDPYFLGIWIGDGKKDLKNGLSISKPDIEIQNACQVEADRWGLELRVDRAEGKCPTYRIVKPTMGPSENPFVGALRKLCPCGPEVPGRYLVGSREERLQILAGLLDTDSFHDGRGGFQFSQKDARVARQVEYLARSLGFRATASEKTVPGYGLYQIVSISGDTDEIPTRIPRKKAPPRRQKKRVTRTGFKVTPIGEGEYFGFTLDGDGRFLLGDFTVTHNTEVFAALAQAVPIRWLVLVDTKDLMYQAADRFFQRTGERAGLAGDGEWWPHRFTVATLQTLLKGLGDGGHVDALLNASQGLVGDEVQVLAALEFRKVAMATPNAWWRFGVSATPLEREDESDYRAIEVLGPLIVDVKPKPLIEAGYLARPDIVFVRHRHEKMSGSFPVVYEAGVVLNEKRNALAARIAGDPDLCPRPTLAFFKAIAHGRKLVKAVEPRARIEMVDGSASAGKGGRRDAVRHRLRMGLTDVLAASRIFNKGIDIPEVESGVNAAAGASRIDALQKVGRLMRVVGSKRVVRYWDFMDVGNHWLEGHARARIEAFRSREYDVRVVDEADLPALAREKLA